MATKFSLFIDSMRPLKGMKESIEMFTKVIIEAYTPYESESELVIERKDPTIKKYALGSRNPSKDFANAVLQAKDEESLKEFIEKNSSDSVSALLVDNFSKNFNLQNINLFDIADEIPKILTSILEEIATSKNKKQTISINSEDFFKKIKIENGNLCIGNSKISIPKSDTPTDEINEEELKLLYLPELINAYSDAENVTYNISDISKLKKKYKGHLLEQRINFYEADCLKRFSRDTLKSSNDEFQKLLDETYDGVISTCRKNHNNGYERALSVLEQSTKIELSGSQLYHIPEMINNKRRQGFCHMLVNEEKIKWVEDDE